MRRKTLKKVLRYIGHYRLFLVLSMVFACVSAALQLYVPLLFGDAIDAIVTKLPDGGAVVDLAGVVRFLVRIFVLIAVASAATYGMNLCGNHLTYRVVEEIRGKAIRKIQSLPLSYLDVHPYGDIVSRVITDADQFSDGLLLGFSQLFSGIVTIAVTLGFMLSKSVIVTVFVLALTPLSFLVARFIATHSYDMFQKQSKARGAQTALITEMIGEGKTLKAFGYGKRASERFSEINRELTGYSEKAVFYSSLTNPSTRFVNSCIYAGVALIGALRILSGHLTVGGLSTLLAYANQYMKPFNDISGVVTELQNAFACAERIFDLLEEKEEVREESAELEKAQGSVEIRNVAFSYDPEKELIRDFNLSVSPGMRIAIVGPTGCGKTTFINLLMRFYDVREGSILVDGRDIREVTRKSLRKNYGMVLQETWLKKGTVRDNILIGKPEATEEEIIEACKKAHSYSFIRRLPQGLDTPVTEESLSQGQKQLLCITRVMLALPPMLILDEATSSIDTRTEVRIQKAFEEMMRGRTSFIVAHRLSTIRSADIILVMKDGKIVEQGSHTELLEKGGFYASLYNSQFEASSAEAV